ncbi:hypothetical protein FXO38_07215 [Capsicum annuum]|nr:hypothetical protein FXO38_07215 [Capsicum annuum]KAF3673611.1 hypothetical protein FXO37_06895 [Capsicum annuum]
MSSSSNFIKIGMKHLFENLIMTIIVRMLFGKEYDLEGGQRARIAIRKLFKLLGTFVVADFIPSLRWLDIRGYEKKMKENAKETDCARDEDLPGFDADTIIKSTCLCDSAIMARRRAGQFPICQFSVGLRDVGVTRRWPKWHQKAYRDNGASRRQPSSQ